MTSMSRSMSFDFYFCSHEAELVKRGARVELTVDGGAARESEAADAADLRAKTSNLFIGEQ